MQPLSSTALDFLARVIKQGKLAKRILITKGGKKLAVHSQDGCQLCRVTNNRENGNRAVGQQTMKSVILQYVGNQQLEREIERTKSFRTATLAQNTQAYGNYKILTKEIKGDLNKGKDILPAGIEVKHTVETLIQSTNLMKFQS